MTSIGWDKEEQATRVARLLPRGGYVNLGIGMPTLVARHLSASQDITLHCENGIIGYGPVPAGEPSDPDVIDAGRTPVALLPGAAIVGHDTSFAIARSGRLHVSVLGAYQVSAQGDLANWSDNTPLSGVGGAMDLAVGARQVIAMMRHVDRDGNPKVVRECAYPLTAARCVTSIVTDLAVLTVTPEGLQVRELAPGLEVADLQEVTEPRLLNLTHGPPQTGR